MPDQKPRFKILLDNVQKTDPEDWGKFTPTTQRHPIYRTLLSTFSEGTLKLIKTAKDYVDTVYSEKGVSQPISVKWTEYDYETDAYEEVFAIGRLNLANGKYKRKRTVTEVGFEPTDFVMDLLNRDEIETSLQELVDFSGDAITTFTDEYHTVEVSAEATKLTGVINAFKQNENLNQATITDRYLQIGLDSYTLNQFSFPEIAAEFKSGSPAAVGDQIDATENKTLRAQIDYNLEVAFRIVELVSLTYSQTMTINFKYQINGGAAQTIATVSETASGSGDYNFIDNLIGTFDADLELTIGDTVRFYIEFAVTSSTLNENVNYYYEVDPTAFDFSIRNLAAEEAATDCNVMLTWEFLLRLCQKVTGVNDCLRSNFFGRTDGEVHTYASDGEGSLYGISNVKQLRGFPIASNPIRSSLMHAFRQLDSIFLLGLGITYESGTPYISIEKLSDFMDNDTVLFTVNALDPGIEWESAISYIWGTVKCGYKNFKNDETATLASPHSPRQYIIPYLNQAVNAEYNIQAEIIASPHLIENLRTLYKYADDNLKDTNYDENLIILSLKRDGAGGYEMKYDSDFDSITGIPTITDKVTPLYNNDITPARNIRRHAPLLQAGLAKRIINDGSFNEYLRFESGEGNLSVITDKAGEAYTIEEDQNLSRTDLTTDLQNELFDASELGTVQAKLTKAQRQLINEDITKSIAIVSDGVTYKGLIESIREVSLIENIAEIKFLNTTDSPPRSILLETGDPIETEAGGFFEMEG